MGDLVNRLWRTFLRIANVNSGRRLASIGIQMPSQFPADVYDRVHTRISDSGPSNLPIQEQWRGAWNAVAHRYLATSRAATAFAESVSRTGDAPLPDERYEQDVNLFGFFVNGLSTLESLAYAAHAAGALGDPSAFPLTTEAERRGATLAAAGQRFGTLTPAPALAKTFAGIEASGAYVEMKHARNVLAHRAVPGRLISRSVGTAVPLPPATWKLRTHGGTDIVLDAHTTTTRLAWLTDVVSELIAGLDQYSLDRFGP